MFNLNVKINASEKTYPIIINNNEIQELQGEILNIMQLPQNYDVKNIPQGILQKNVPSLLNYRKE